MREIAKQMIQNFKINELGYDFMGYEESENGILTFHHLLIPRSTYKEYQIEDDGYLYWNGAIIRELPHGYLHLIEVKDYEIFSLISSEMLDENIKGFLDIKNIEAINDLLSYFEREHCGDTSRNGNPLIQEPYTRRLVKNRKETL